MKIRICCPVLLALLAAWSLSAAQPPTNPGAEPAAKAGPYDVVFLSHSRPVVVRLDLRADGKPLQAAWDDFVDYLFKFADTNGDGVLSREEADAAPNPSSFNNNPLFGGFGGFGGPSPNSGKMDANGDGKVTRQEYADYVRQAGLPPFQVHAGPEGPGPNRGFPAVNMKPKTTDLNNGLMKLLDKDGDGKLSRAELAAAAEVFRRLDLDEDEVITHKELLPDFSSINFGFASYSMAAGPQKQGPDNSPVFLASGTGAPSQRELARRLLAVYGGASGPKALTNASLSGLDAREFAQLDRDGNGELDAEELARFLPRKPDVTLVVRIGERKVTEPGVELVGKPAAGITVRVAQDTLVLTFRNDQMAVRVGASKPRSQLGFILRQAVTAQFQQADRDNNGYIDEKEAAMSGFGRIFKQLDKDGDGKIYEKEILAYLDTIEGFQTRATAGCVSLHFSDSKQSLFDLFDADRDGRLSQREIRAMPKLVDELDRNGDGAIGPEEIPWNYVFRVEQGAGNKAGADPFSVLESLGVNATAPPPTGKGPTWFQRMDRNRDGDVSRAEFLGSDTLFRRIDADGDGLISLQEALRFEERLKNGAPRR